VTTDVKGGLTDINWLSWGMLHFYSHEILSIPRDTDALRLLLSKHFRMSAPNFDYLKDFDLNKLRDIDQGNGVLFVWIFYEDNPKLFAQILKKWLASNILFKSIKIYKKHQKTLCSFVFIILLLFFLIKSSHRK
jgi:hypothetical protein